eukprot:COSAG02_NODE_52801_length_305_cov_1.500000_1_plen_64_part_01
MKEAIPVDVPVGFGLEFPLDQHDALLITDHVISIEHATKPRIALYCPDPATDKGWSAGHQKGCD